MKKIMIIIAALVMGINANAQLAEDYTSFKLGVYTFGIYLPKYVQSAKQIELYQERIDEEYPKNGGGRFCCIVSDYGEMLELFFFIQTKQGLLEKKYGVTITDVEYRSGVDYRVYIKVYNPDIYNKNKEIERQQKEKEEQARRQRLDSLKDIL